MKAMIGKAFAIGFCFNHKHVLLPEPENEPRALGDTSITGCGYRADRNFKSTAYNDIVTNLKTYITVAAKVLNEYLKLELAL